MSHLSNETAQLIDAEVRGLLDRCYQRAKAILEENRDKLEMMKDALMEYETIDSDQIDDIMAGKNRVLLRLGVITQARIQVPLPMLLLKAAIWPKTAMPKANLLAVKASPP